MKKRLFIFAGYDKDAIADATLIWYLNALSKLGDIVFTMDSDASDSELSKITEIPNVLYASAVRHGEYDFGSYKRGYIWARDNKLLSKYNWVYFVNDSVYGPLWDIENILKDLESRGTDLIGMTYNNNEGGAEHIQSWFVGVSKKIATSDFFAEFLCAVKVAIHDVDSLLLYSCTSEQLVDDIYNNVTRTLTHIKKTKQAYEKLFRFSIFALPIVCIYGKYDKLSRCKSYKVTLFDKIPLIKFLTNKMRV